MFTLYIRNVCEMQQLVDGLIIIESRVHTCTVIDKLFVL